jgi:hypothetical protein
VQGTIFFVFPRYCVGWSPVLQQFFCAFRCSMQSMAIGRGKWRVHRRGSRGLRKHVRDGAIGVVCPRSTAMSVVSLGDVNRCCQAVPPVDRAVRSSAEGLGAASGLVASAAWTRQSPRRGCSDASNAIGVRNSADMPAPSGRSGRFRTGWFRQVTRGPSSSRHDMIQVGHVLTKEENRI